MKRFLTKNSKNELKNKCWKFYWIPINIPWKSSIIKIIKLISDSIIQFHYHYLDGKLFLYYRNQIFANEMVPIDFCK